MKNPFSLGRWLWEMYYAKRDMDNLCGYIHENVNTCDDLLIVPSKELRKRYNIRPTDQSAHIFALLEKYYNSKK